MFSLVPQILQVIVDFKRSPTSFYVSLRYEIFGEYFSYHEDTIIAKILQIIKN